MLKSTQKKERLLLQSFCTRGRMRLEVEWDFVEFGHIFLETKKKKQMENH